jgi:deazaflavin-dependent oxidoreductase (nitroreductase family)
MRRRVHESFGFLIEHRIAGAPGPNRALRRYRRRLKTEDNELSDDPNANIINEFRTNKGVVGGGFAGIPLLLLHHTGAKSGKARVNPVMYNTEGGDLVVFASKGGAPSDPDWFRNLLANPKTEIEVGMDTFPVTARVAEAGERDRIWERQKREYPQFAEYEKKADRQIPVVILTRT